MNLQQMLEQAARSMAWTAGHRAGMLLPKWVIALLAILIVLSASLKSCGVAG